MSPAAKPAPNPSPRAKKAGPAKTAPARAAGSVPELLARDPAGQIRALLAGEPAPLAAGAIKKLLVQRGATQAEADRAWARAQERIRFDDHVLFEQNTYRYTEQPRTITPGEAVYRLSKGGDQAQRERWLAVIESALAAASTDPVQLADARTKIAEAERRIRTLEQELSKLSTAPAPAPEPDAHVQFDRAERRRAARERQARIDAMSTVAELAAQVEELTAKKATAEVLLEHTRALTGDRGLEAIGRAGETSAYDETRHDPVGDVPAEGEPVTVIRPGYLWHAPGEAVLISRALVKRK